MFLIQLIHFLNYCTLNRVSVFLGRGGEYVFVLCEVHPLLFVQTMVPGLNHIYSAPGLFLHCTGVGAVGLLGLLSIQFGKALVELGGQPAYLN